MRSRTHIVVGLASAVTAVGAFSPVTTKMWYCSILGGVLGAALPDLDIRTGKKRKDAIRGTITAAVIAACVLFLDRMSGAEIARSLADRTPDSLVEGVLIALMVLIGMKKSPHRGFSHSLAAMFLMCLALERIMKPMIPFFAAGFVSHLALDVLNKKAVHIFFPFGKGISLKMCASDQRADTWCFGLGALWLMAAVARLVTETGAIVTIG